jgi:predicted hotdog family 3-hydroxylacyl-ACP dehydratase
MVMPMLDIDIEKFIPHRDGIRLLDGVLQIADDSAVTTATVKSTWPLSNGESINPLILVETIAQSAALVEGYKRSRQGMSSSKGWLVGIKHAEFNADAIPVNTNLIISVKSMYSFDNYGVIEGTVKSGDKIVATMVLQALRMDGDKENIFGGGENE